MVCAIALWVFFERPPNNLLERGDIWVHVLKVWRSRIGEDLWYFQNISPMLSTLWWKKSRVHCLILIISTCVVLLLYCQLCPHLYMLSVRIKTFSPAACSLRCGQGKECTQLKFCSTSWGGFVFFSFCLFVCSPPLPLLVPQLFWADKMHLVFLLLDSEGEQVLGRDLLLPTCFSL